MNQSDVELLCNGCGKDKSVLAALRSVGVVVAMFCRECLLEAAELLSKEDQEEGPSRPGTN